MKKKLPLISLLFFGVYLLGIAFVTACMPTTTVTYDLNMRPGQQYDFSIELKEHDKLDISISVQQYDIGIMVESPSGQVALPYKRVETENFIIIAEEDGVYVVTLDNSYSISNSKRLTLILKYPQKFAI